MRALPLGAVVLAILIASCGASPGVSVSIASEPIPMVLASTTNRVGCTSEHGDAFPQQVPLTTIRTSAPVTLKFEAGSGANEIRGAIYDVKSPSTLGGPIEEFLVRGPVGTYEARTIVPGRTYQILVNVVWSFVVTSGEESHLFRVTIEPP
jgi:hypothetical protein